MCIEYNIILSYTNAWRWRNMLIMNKSVCVSGIFEMQFPDKTLVDKQNNCTRSYFPSNNMKMFLLYPNPSFHSSPSIVCTVPNQIKAIG